MHPLPPLTGPWWSLARFGSLLPTVHWPEDVLGTNTCSWCPSLSKMTWIGDYWIGDHCLRWSSWVSRTYKQYFSIQNFVPLLLWLLLVLPLRPISWSSQSRRVETSSISFPVVGGPQCRSLIVRMAKVRKWSSSFPLGLVGHFHTFGNCHIFWRNLLRFIALWVKNNMPSWSSGRGTLLPCGRRKLSCAPLPKHIWLPPLLCTSSKAGRSLFCKPHH